MNKASPIDRRAELDELKRLAEQKQQAEASVRDARAPDMNFPIPVSS